MLTLSLYFSLYRIREAARPGPSIKSAIAHTFLRDTRNSAFLATSGSLFKATQVSRSSLHGSPKSLREAILTCNLLLSSSSFAGARGFGRRREALQVHDRDGYDPSSWKRIRKFSLAFNFSFASRDLAELTSSLFIPLPRVSKSVRVLHHSNRSRPSSRPFKRNSPRR